MVRGADNDRLLAQSCVRAQVGGQQDADVYKRQAAGYAARGCREGAGHGNGRERPRRGGADRYGLYLSLIHILPDLSLQKS